MEAFGKTTRVPGTWLAHPARTKAATARRTRNGLCINFIKAPGRCSLIIHQRFLLSCSPNAPQTPKLCKPQRGKRVPHNRKSSFQNTVMVRFRVVFMRFVK
jgi:hypothetical protein